MQVAMQVVDKWMINGGSLVCSEVYFEKLTLAVSDDKGDKNIQQMIVPVFLIFIRYIDSVIIQYFQLAPFIDYPLYQIKWSHYPLYHLQIIHCTIYSLSIIPFIHYYHLQIFACINPWMMAMDIHDPAMKISPPPCRVLENDPAMRKGARGS